MKNLKLSFTVIATLVLLLISIQVNAATYYSRGSGVFTAAIWSTTRGGAAITPTGTNHTYNIQTGNNVTLGASQTSVAVIVESGGTMTNGNTWTLTSPLTINSGGTLAIAATRFTISGNLINAGTITATGTGRLTLNTASTLTNSGSITMGAGRFILGTGTFTNEATGTLKITGTATVTLGTGDFVNNNTSASVDFGSSAVALTGTAQSIGGFTTTGLFSTTNTSGTITLTGNVNCNGITRNGNGGTLNLGTGLNHTTTGVVTLTAGTMDGGSSTLNVNVVSGTAWTGTGTVFSAGTSTVNFGAAGNQTLSATGTKTFYNLTLSNSGTKTIASTTVNNILSMEGTATASATPTYGGSATLRYNTATSRTVGAEWLASFAATGGVIIDNTGIITTNGNKVFNTNIPLTINSGATLTTGANTFSFSGDFINDGTWTPSSGAVTITSTGTQSIGTFSTTGAVAVSKTSGIATLLGDISGGAFTKSGAGTINMGADFNHTFAGTFALGTAGTVNGGSSTININGASITGTATVFVPGTSTVIFGAAGNQTVTATGTESFYKLIYAGSGTKTMSGYSVANIFELQGTALASAAPTYGTNATLRYNKVASSNAGAEWVSPFTATGGVIIDNVGAVNPNGNKVFNLDIPLNIISGATLSPAAGNTFSFGGDFINDGIWTPCTGDVTIALNRVGQNIGTLTTTGIVYLTKTAGSATFTGNIQGGGLTLNATGGTLNLGVGLEHIFTGDLAGTGGTLNGNSSTIRIGAAVQAAISFNANTGTVDYNGAVPQTIPAVPYYNLQTSGPNTKSLGGDTAVGGVFTNNTGATFFPDTYVMTLSGAGTTFVNIGTFTAGTSTINFTNAGSVNIPALNYYNLNGTGGPRVLAGSGVIGIANTFTPGAGAYTITGSTVSFNGAGAQTIPAFTFNEVILTNAGDKTIDNAVSVSNITIETGPILNLNSTAGGVLTIY